MTKSTTEELTGWVWGKPTLISKGEPETSFELCVKIPDLDAFGKVAVRCRGSLAFQATFLIPGQPVILSAERVEDWRDSGLDEYLLCRALVSPDPGYAPPPNLRPERRPTRNRGFGT